MKKRTFLFIIMTVLLLFVSFIVVANNLEQPEIKIQDGTASLKLFDDKNTYLLNGEWEVYHDLLIGSNDIDVSTVSRKTTTLPNKDSKGFTKYGYISYRTVLTDVPKEVGLFLQLNKVHGGYIVYFNREMILTNNKLKTTDQRVRFDEKFVEYISDGQDIEIIIEISNYQFDFTGLQTSPRISTTERFRKNFTMDIMLKSFLIGSLFYVAVYFFILNGLRNADKGAVFFSLFAFCGVVSLATYKSGFSFVVDNLFRINEVTMYYLHYSSYYLATLFLFLYLKTLFNQKKLSLSEHIFAGIIAAVSLSPVLFTIRSFLQQTHIYGGINVVLLSIILIWAILNFRKREIFPSVLIILVLILLGGIYDLLIHEHVLVRGDKISVIIFLVTSIIFGALSSYKRELEISNVQEVHDLQEKIRDTEFTFLNSQIQSHFIYNTLNSIQALCYTSPDRAAELIEDFSMYLRTRLEFNKMPNLIDIEDELENIRTYLQIEKERFGDRVNFEYHLKVGDFKIPPLTIQPLVENAVKHGISKKKGGGTVKISTFKDKNNLYIQIDDDGIGFDPESLGKKQRVGTENIRHRLQLHLHASIVIKSSPGKGTTSTVTIPLSTKPNP